MLKAPPGLLPSQAVQGLLAAAPPQLSTYQEKTECRSHPWGSKIGWTSESGFTGLKMHGVLFIFRKLEDQNGRQRSVDIQDTDMFMQSPREPE
jgi:hypothetical protein